MYTDLYLFCSIKNKKLAQIYYVYTLKCIILSTCASFYTISSYYSIYILLYIYVQTNVTNILDSLYTNNAHIVS